MPIKTQSDLPAKSILEHENIFVMDEFRAIHQDIRPLSICILNLMPVKEDTELQLLRALSNTPLQVDVTFMKMSTHVSLNTSANHLNKFYHNFDELKHKKFDGMIITGAPVENMEFEEVAYWPELAQLMEWSKTHVTSTFHICWGAQAGLYYHYGIPKIPLESKLFGVFEHQLDCKHSMLFRGFDDTFVVPHSRHTTCRREDIEAVEGLKILSSSKDAGVFVCVAPKGRQIFVTGHSEYDGDTLKKEYLRDKQAGLPIDVPVNYFPEDDDSREPIVRWRSCANLLYSNWLNYFVYQSTPYDIDEIK